MPIELVDRLSLLSKSWYYAREGGISRRACDGVPPYNLVFRWIGALLENRYIAMAFSVNGTYSERMYAVGGGGTTNVLDNGSGQTSVKPNCHTPMMSAFRGGSFPRQGVRHCGPKKSGEMMC